MKNGRVWFSAIYGEYDSLSEAKAALEELNKKTGKKDLWLRRFSDVQKIIKSAPSAELVGKID
jgi:septal ring-binding cell division protein DamX